MTAGGRTGIERRGGDARGAHRLRRLVERLAARHERRARTAMAEALVRAVEEVDRPPRRVSAAASIDRRGVAESASLLLAVAARLRAPGPLPPEALRLARSLTGDAASPLYAGSAHRSEYPPGTLRRFALAILATCPERRPVPARAPDVPIRI